MEKEKKEFIWKKGILGFGIPIAATMSVIVGYQVPGSPMKLHSFDVKNCFFAALILVPLFSIAGFFWGFFVYNPRKKK